MEGIALGVGGGGGSAAEIIAHAQRMEKLGYDFIGGGGENWGRDGVTPMAYIAAHTQRIGLALGVLNVYSRSPALIAQTVATLDELSGGRVRVSLGTSGPILVEQWHGVPYERPIQRTREYIEIMRLVLSGERVNYDGQFFHLQRFRLGFTPLRPNVPVYVASLGPKNLELTGELADGWLPVYLHLDYLDEVKKHIEAGAGKAGRSLSDIDLAPSLMVAVVESEEERQAARQRVKTTLAHYAAEMGDYYANLLRRYGFDQEVADIQQVRAGGDRAGFIERVTDEMVDALSAIGPEGYCRERIAQFRDKGVGSLTLSTIGPSREVVNRTLEGLAPTSTSRRVFAT